MTEADRSREDEWFLRNEKELIERARKEREQRSRERAAGEQAEARERLKAQHFMKCPKCGHDLREERIGDVLVDRCSFCEGLYLDAGELDKLLLEREENRRGLLGRLIGLK